jgi:hypothetical protein
MFVPSALINTTSFCMSFAHFANLKVLKVSFLQLLDREMAQIMVNFAFPPKDSCNKRLILNRGKEYAFAFFVMLLLEYLSSSLAMIENG